MKRFYLCIDLKTFYASVECVERGLDPFKVDLIVADAKKGNGAICLAISPKMKARGIINRCRVWEIPKYVHPIVAKPRMKKYIEYSAKIYSIYLKYVAKEDIHPYSIDEMFLDVTNYLKLYKKNPIELAKTIIKELWHHTPITDFWRINIGTENRLHKLHLKDMYDVAHCDQKILYKEFGKNAKFLIDHACGIEPCTIADIKAYKPKHNSFSNSQILFKDYNFEQTRIVLSEMIDNMVLRLVEKKLYTSYIGIYIGYSKNVIKPLKFSFKLENATSSYKFILNKVLEEYDYRINEQFLIRRIGITFGNVSKKKYEQINLFNSFELEKEENKLEETVIKIKNKFGKNSILRATSYLSDATGRERNKLIGGHNAE